MALYNKELSKTGRGPFKAEVPSDLQFKIAEIIESICIQGVPETQYCNTSAAQSSSKESPNTSKSANAKEANSPESSVSEEPAVKRRKNQVRSVREQTQRELPEGQKCFQQFSAMLSAVVEIRDELRSLNATIVRVGDILLLHPNTPAMQQHADNSNGNHVLKLPIKHPGFSPICSIFNNDH